MAITGPIAPYSNLPIEPQYFAPWRFVISAISLGVTTTVTLVIPSITELHYVIGQQVRLIIPPTFGCRQLNEQTAYVISITEPNIVVLTLNSLLADPYIASTATTPAQLLAIGDINSGHINRTRWHQKPWIPGSFRKIFPDNDND
jgi:hypothetical protein